MKSSTYAVLIGVYLLLIGPVILFRPAEILNIMRAFTDQRILLLVGTPFVMISVLVLVHDEVQNLEKDFEHHKKIIEDTMNETCNQGFIPVVNM